MGVFRGVRRTNPEADIHLNVVSKSLVCLAYRHTSNSQAEIVSACSP